ncbi:MAG: hypothetical protein KDD94_03040 [Calditrichaeota bacterium]|nr:hypothetical protein [Calditrichota bacterium]
MKKFVLLSVLLIIIATACKDTTIETKIDPAKIELGRKLFFDKRLSQDNSVSCASCHQPQLAFSDNKRFSTGVFQQETGRNSPPLNHLDKQRSFFHDGRAKTLVQQAMEVMNNPKEMGDASQIPAKLRLDSNYVNQFQSIYHAEINLFLVADALTEFERSLQFRQSPYDHFLAGDSNALTSDQKKGLLLFKGKARCITCHSGTDLTDNQFYNIGFFSLSDSTADIGRFKISGDSTDLGRFRTPSLRNVALTAPYFHDGQIPTLREVINRYNKPNPMGEGDFKDKKLRAIHLSEVEKYQLQQFLMSLTDQGRLRDFSDKDFIDSLISVQNYSKTEYEQFDLLSGFDQKVNYFRLFYPKLLKDAGLIQLDKLSDPDQQNQKKIEIEQDQFRTVYAELFKSGDYLLFNQQISNENQLLNQAGQQFPQANSIENIRKRLKLLEKISKNDFNWSDAIFDYRNKLGLKL